MTLIYIATALLLFSCLAKLSFHIKLYLARKNGKYPLKGHVHEDDVIRLLSEGETTFALSAYRDLHKGSLKTVFFSIHNAQPKSGSVSMSVARASVIIHDHFVGLNDLSACPADRLRMPAAIFVPIFTVFTGLQFSTHQTRISFRFLLERLVLVFLERFMISQL